MNRIKNLVAGLTAQECWQVCRYIAEQAPSSPWYVWRMHTNGAYYLSKYWFRDGKLNKQSCRLDRVPFDAPPRPPRQRR